MIEIQTKFEIHFSTRMYLYQAFIFAKHRLPITALAVFTRASTPKKFDIYETECFGTSLTYKYNAYKIAKQDEVALINSDNIFSLFVLAHLYVIKTTPQKYEQRFRFKEKLFELAYEKQIFPEKIKRLLIFVDEIIALPIQLQNLFVETMADKNPDQALIELQEKMKVNEAVIYNFVIQSRIRKLGLDGFLQQQERLLTAEIEARMEAITKSKIYKMEAKAKAEMQKAEAIAKAEMQKAKAEKQKAEAIAKMEMQKAEAIAKAEMQKAEAIAKTEKQKAETEKLRYQIQSVIALHEQAAFMEDKVASILQLSLNEVAFILNLHKQAIPIDAIVLQLNQFQAHLLKIK